MSDFTGADAAPFGRWPPSTRCRALAATFFASVGVSVLLAVVGAPLTMPAVSGGIVTFEFAGAAAEARRIMAAWGAAGVDAAWTQTWLDFLYLATYGPSLALACGLAAGVWARRGVGYGRLGVLLSWGALAAAVFDAVENAALLLLLGGAVSDAAAGVAWATASAKFALIIAGLVYALFGAALWSTDRLIALARGGGAES
jgi:hypothetical protein